MNIITGPDGQQYVEFNGVVTVPNPSLYDGAGFYTADPYTAAKLFEMRGAMWNERGFGFGIASPIIPPPEPPNRFQHLDWEDGAA